MSALVHSSPTRADGRGTRWRRRLGIAAWLLVATVVGLCTPIGPAQRADAHAILEASEPAAGATLTAPPSRVLLRFSEQVEVALGAVRVFDSTGRRVDDGTAHHADGDGRSVAVELTATTGGYVVTWRVVSADSHPIHGAFTFRVGTAGDSGDLAAEAARLQGADKGDTVVGALAGGGRAMSFGGLLVLVGAASFLAVAWPEGRNEKRTRWLLWIAWSAAVAGAIAVLLLQGPYGAGLPLGRAADPAVIRKVLRTRFGEVYAMRLILLAAAGLLVRTLLKQAGRPVGKAWLIAATIVGATILATPGLAGHASAGPLVPLALPFDLLHLGAAAVWLGGLCALAAALLPPATIDGRADRVVAQAARRYSSWAFFAVLAILVSGLFAAWRQVGSLSLVTTTTFGRLLATKTALFIGLVGIASLSRCIVHGNLDLRGPFKANAQRRRGHTSIPATGRRSASRVGPRAAASDPDVPKAARLRRTVLAELAIAAVLLGVTSMLVNTPPARAAAAKPFSADTPAGDLVVQVTVDPAKSGPVDLHLYTESKEGQSQDVPEVTATLTLEAAADSAVGQLDPVTVTLHRLALGHFAAYRLDIPIKGRWTLAIRVRLDDFTEVAAVPVTIPIR